MRGPACAAELNQLTLLGGSTIVGTLSSARCQRSDAPWCWQHLSCPAGRHGGVSFSWTFSAEHLCCGCQQCGVYHAGLHARMAAASSGWTLLHVLCRKGEWGTLITAVTSSAG